MGYMYRRFIKIDGGGGRYGRIEQLQQLERVE